MENLESVGFIPQSETNADQLREIQLLTQQVSNMVEEQRETLSRRGYLLLEIFFMV
ncbi:MAG: hypothetical protein HC806_06235 [Anaerolineae bacterium]|nr:hypothetical protein [Anaerolineae bacterium]